MRGSTFSGKALGTTTVVYLLLFVAMGLTFHNALNNDFVNWDDFKYVVNNEAAKGFTVNHVYMAFTKIFVGNYAPVHMLSYMFDHELWGMSSFGYILTNLLIHFINGLLIYHIALKMLNSNVGAALASYVFLLHPVQVESVVWISQRKNVLSMMFFLIAFSCYVRHGSLDNKTYRFYVISIIAFLLSVLTKVAAVFLPVTLILYSLCYRRDKYMKQTMVEMMPYFIISLVIIVITMISQKHDQSSVFAQYYAGTAYNTLLTMFTVLPQYLILIIWPQFLSIIYSPSIKEFLDFDVIICMILCGLLLAEGMILYKKHIHLFFWYALFFIAYLPVSQIVPLQTIMQDRYCYFPLFGMCGFIGALVADYSDNTSHATVNKALIVICVLPLILLPVLSHKRTEVWKDTITLFSETYKSGIGNRYSDYANFVELSLADAYVTKAEKYYQANDTKRALHYFLMALQYEPLHYEVLLYVSSLLLDSGKYDTAYPYLAKITENYPRSVIGFYLLGQYFHEKNNQVKAREAYLTSLMLDPSYVLAKEGLASIPSK